MILIGLSGYARSGKDLTASILIDEFGFTRVAFADKLREVLYQLDPIVGFFSASPGGLGTVTVRDVIDRYGWDGYKDTEYGYEIRKLLQRLGTEAGRELLGDSIWVDAALGSLDQDKRYVVTDVRFPNEAQAIIDRGGEVWRVSRVGVGPANDHPSETSLDDWPFHAFIHNDGTVSDLRKNVSRKYLEFVGGDL